MATMKASSTVIEMIKSFEGLQLSAYKCTGGVWSIGYGHTKNVKEGDKISESQAEIYLQIDIQKAENHVNWYNNKYAYGFNQNQFDALVSFTFNIGSIDQLTANGKRTKETIGEKIVLYNKAGGQVIKGLETRRALEQDLFFKEVNENIVTKKLDLNTILHHVKDNYRILNAPNGVKKLGITANSYCRIDGYNGNYLLVRCYVGDAFVDGWIHRDAFYLLLD